MQDKVEHLTKVRVRVVLALPSHICFIHELVIICEDIMIFVPVLHTNPYPLTDEHPKTLNMVLRSLDKKTSLKLNFNNLY